MRVKLFFYLLILSISSNSQTLTFDWVKQIGGARSQITTSITVDISGNVYTTGLFEDTVDFDPGVGEYNLISGRLPDIFIQKLDASGNFIWAKQIGGPGFNVGFSIEADDLGNIYTTGYFEDTVDFDPSSGVNNLISRGEKDIFIQKFDANGNFIWVKQMGGAFYDSGRSINIDASGNVFTTGFFNDTVDFDPGAGVNNLISNGARDIFIQKLDANGNFIWVKQMGGISFESGISIKVDAIGNIYTMGAFSSTVDFDPGAGVSNLTYKSNTDYFIQKLDVNGNFIWAKQLGSIYGGTIHSLDIDASGNVFTTGSFLGTLDFDPGAGVSNLTASAWGDIFIQKLDSNGNFIWAKQMGGTGVDIGSSITVDDFGNIYTTGSFEDLVDFNPGAGVSNITSNGSHDIFIQKLDANGDFIWIKQMGSPGYERATSNTVDASGNVYTTGYFRSTVVDFDPGPGVSSLISYGYDDSFIQKLRVSGVGIIENDFGSEILIYPNPTDGNFLVDLGENYKSVLITITDLAGRLIQSNNYNESQLLNLNLEEPAGIYLLVIETSNKKAVFRIVKK